MSEIINLRQARKRAARAAQETAAAENRAKFGQTKAARKAQAQETEMLRKTLDEAKREGGSCLGDRGGNRSYQGRL